MKPVFKIEDHSVHLWQAHLPELLPQINDFSLLLDQTELARARRFKFELHRQRFILSHAILRQILGLYLQMTPADILFELNPRGKPGLKDQESRLQFNMSHSGDMAVFAFAMHAEIGVDIEKIEPTCDMNVAKRLFSANEYEALSALPPAQKVEMFYRTWASREAVIKAVGGGIFAPLPNFSVDFEDEIQTIDWIEKHETRRYHLQQVSFNDAYQSAFAVGQTIKNGYCWKFTAEKNPEPLWKFTN